MTWERQNSLEYIDFCTYVLYVLLSLLGHNSMEVEEMMMLIRLLSCWFLITPIFSRITIFFTDLCSPLHPLMIALNYYMVRGRKWLIVVENHTEK